MTKSILIAGGGIAGMAAACAMTRLGWQAQVFEQATEFSEVGAGIQLGPNVTRILQAWGLGAALMRLAAKPSHLRVRSLHNAQVLASLSLHQLSAKYGAPYVTIHRVDLHELLLEAAQAQGVCLQLQAHAVDAQTTAEQAVLRVVENGQTQAHSAAVVAVADGVWSRLRQQLLADGSPTFTGHIAYRALVAQADLPELLRSTDVTVWLGPDVHVVCYPVRGGEWLNVVCLIEGDLPNEQANQLEVLQRWNSQKSAPQTQAELRRVLAGAASPLRDLMEACQGWRLWPLCGRPAMRGTHEHVQGRIALLGDAAHPMLPYLAQGAGMAIEDAHVLAAQLSLSSHAELPQRLQQFAQARWQRNARVQAKAVRNGQIFHATGLMRLGRDLSLRLAGARLMEMPWLYGHG